MKPDLELEAWRQQWQADTEVPGWRMTRVNQTHRGRAKRKERRKRKRKKRRGEETSNLGNHVHHHVRMLL